MSSVTAAERNLPGIPALAAPDYVSKQLFLVPDVTGEPVVALSMVPTVFVSRAMSALRKGANLELAARTQALHAAVSIFRDETIGGMSPATYRAMTSRIAGLPITNVDHAIDSIVAAGYAVERTIDAATPTGVSRDWSDPALTKGGAVWVPRGETLAIHAAGNSPAIHASWLQALALGLRIAVRPSRRDPLTPYRLIMALRRAGFANDQVMLLPTDYAAGEEILHDADLSVVYGNDAVVSKYVADPHVLVMGPGRSKMLIARDVNWQEHLDVIVRTVAAGGGTSCMNATALFVEGDPSAVAEALAERLSALPSLPPQDERAALPVVALDRAKEFEDYFLAKAKGARVWLGGDGIADNLEDGSAVLRPAVTEVTSGTDPRVHLELPFPCVWVAPWSQTEGLAPLRHSLSVTLLAADSRLASALIGEPSIANVTVGDADAGWDTAHLPHDDYFARFLMRAKTVRLSAS